MFSIFATTPLNVALTMSPRVALPSAIPQADPLLLGSCLSPNSNGSIVKLVSSLFAAESIKTEYILSLEISAVESKLLISSLQILTKVLSAFPPVRDATTNNVLSLK